MTESLPSALEPELRRIIDTAVARVAAIELEAIREARELTQRSEEEARQALRFALDRAFNLINTLELLAATVSGMAEALKIELDDAITALRNVPEPESELAKEIAAAAPEQAAPAEQSPAEPPAPEPRATEPPAPEPQAAEPPAPEPQAAEPATAEPQSEQETQAEDEPAITTQGRNGGYPPADRQAESLAASAAEEPEQAEEPEEPAADEAPAVPARRRGFVRRLFSSK